MLFNRWTIVHASHDRASVLDCQCFTCNNQSPAKVAMVAISRGTLAIHHFTTLMH